MSTWRIDRNGGDPRQSPKDLPDAEFLSKVAAGDLAALGALYDRHARELHGFFRRATGTPGDVDDLVHDTFVALLRAAPNYDGRASVRAFLYGVAVKLLRRRSQRFARWARALTVFGRDLAGQPPRTPEEVAGDDEALDLVGRAFAKMSDEKRLVLLMIEREGMSGKEVAAALGIPLATVWTRLHHARGDLRRALEKRRRA